MAGYFVEDVFLFLILIWIVWPAIPTSFADQVIFSHIVVEQSAPKFDPGTPIELIVPVLLKPIPLIETDSNEDSIVMKLLHDGAVMLDDDDDLGEPGNVVIAAHSSGPAAFGPYRQAFAHLADLKIGQEFSITTTTAVFSYKIVNTDIVWPNEVDKLPENNDSTVTLVTCWPRFTDLKRLLIHGKLLGVHKS